MVVTAPPSSSGGVDSGRDVVVGSVEPGRAGPLNPGRSPVDITATGWYTLRHTFQDNGAGVLEVVLELLDASDSVIGTWTLSDASDVIGTTVGGNRYGGFFFASTTHPFASLAIDNSLRDSL